MNTNNKNTKMSLAFLLLSSLLLTGCSETFSGIISDKKVDTEAQKAKLFAYEANRVLKETKIKDIHAIKDEKISALEAQLQQDKEELTAQMESESATKQKLLLNETKDKLQQLKVQAQIDKTKVIIAVEQEISTTESQTESKLVKKILDSEVKTVSGMIKKEMKITAEYKKELAAERNRIKAEARKKLATLKINVANHRKYNKDLLSLKTNELERIRLEHEMHAKQKAVDKNNAILTKLANKYEADVVALIKAAKKSLKDNEKSQIGNIERKFSNAKAKREATNEKRLQDLGSKNKQIKQAVGNEKRSSLKFVRTAKLKSVETNLQANIKRAKVNEGESLSVLKADLDIKLSNAVKNIEDIVIEKKKYLAEQALQEEQRVINEYNEKDRLIEKQ